jgi:hypothetical protein
MTVRGTRVALFFDVRDFTARGDLAIASDDAAAGERGEPEKSNETHHASEAARSVANIIKDPRSKQCAAEMRIGAAARLEQSLIPLTKRTLRSNTPVRLRLSSD